MHIWSIPTSRSFRKPSSINTLSSFSSILLLLSYSLYQPSYHRFQTTHPSLSILSPLRQTKPRNMHLPTILLRAITLLFTTTTTLAVPIEAGQTCIGAGRPHHIHVSSAPLLTRKRRPNYLGRRQVLPVYRL
ncbi:hypothetical protein BU26DRAFT_50026 [Trematosphaeria pertusa]|uniref:Uncharacterized protein n=1 Tax=Trematosphaeria pertusa TaxID=390896 RepID=A0A6A6IAP8_9PLEO|nr:uncharacterized protein BU26DRAFT_50026 [Trematosphaeria pertusa]KAF2246610.1 hypothetical protein BU26DRAFT_50026 [Trematosphaeria pertusa]